MITLHPPHAQALRTSARASLLAAGPSLWRVVDNGGRIVGHIAANETEAGTRYDARRYRASAHTLVSIGEFWSPDDAVEVLLRGG
jgi:hypothetical protein